jgi:hemolysin activation/secretion protein
VRDYSEADVVEEPFNALDISSKTTSYGQRLSEPLHQTVRHQWLGALVPEKRESESSLLGPTLFFSPGAQGGETDVTVIRLLQQGVDRSPEQVLALRANRTRLAGEAAGQG